MTYTNVNTYLKKLHLKINIKDRQWFLKDLDKESVNCYNFFFIETY